MSTVAGARRARVSLSPPPAGSPGPLSLAAVAATRPQPPAEVLVPRPRLVQRLIRGTPAVVLLAAPAGYGKTTLLAEWQSCEERPFAWLTLDKSHDAGAAFVAAVEDALDAVTPTPAPRRGTSARARRGAVAVALPRLVRSLVARAPFVLVLDDLQALGANAAREAVRTLARHIPPDCRLVLASRTEPALPTGRLRANRALTELRSRDLRMTTGEATALLKRSGLDMGSREAEQLARKTEGWPAGLLLASVAVRSQPDLSAAVMRFGGDEAIVSEYLRDEVLSQLTPQAALFLKRTSILDRLSGPLCDAVLQSRGSAAMLSALGRSDLLLVPLDSKGESYRCHDLLAEMLRVELRRTDPDEEARLHCRAADWHANMGETDLALDHAAAAGDSERAAGLLGTTAAAHVTRPRNAALRTWLASFTPQQVATQPALTLAAANSDLLEGRLDSVYRWESTARQALHETPPDARTQPLESAVALLHAVMARDGLARMGEDARSAYGLEPEDSPWRPICCLLEGVSRHLTGDREPAESLLEEGVRRGTVAAPNIQTLCLAQLAVGAAERDDWGSAASFAARAMAQVEHYALHEYPTSALVFAVSASIRAHTGKVAEAHGDIREATRLLGMLTDFMPWYEVETRVALAHAAVRLSDIAAARDLLADARRLARRTPDAVVLHEWIERLDARVDSASDGQGLLTTAELRVLGYLPTHLSFREIAGRLYVSANTVKTQAHAVYRKLDAASRSQAVTRAGQLGLLDV